MTRVDDLIARGATQQSRKYRRLFIAPESPSKWLREKKPEMYDLLVEKTLLDFESACRQQAWLDAVCRQGPDVSIELTQEEFDEFREKTTGKKPWSPIGKEQCPDCLSLGHMHRRDCKALKQENVWVCECQKCGATPTLDCTRGKPFVCPSCGSDDLEPINRP